MIILIEDVKPAQTTDRPYGLGPVLIVCFFLYYCDHDVIDTFIIIMYLLALIAIFS